MLRPGERRNARSAAGLLLVALVLAAAPAAAGIQSSTVRPRPSLLVKLDPALPAPKLPRGAAVVGRTLTGVAVVALPRGANVSAWARLIAKLPGVVYAEPNATARGAAAAPNDVGFGQQWAWGPIRAVDGWAAYPGGYPAVGGATIAIVDTGIDSSHPDLVGRVATSLGASCIDPSGSCTAGSAPDDNGHGTHVAGIAGAATNNSIGVAGTAFDAQLIPVKVLDASNTGSYAAITNGIIWAAQHGAKVINLSLVGSVASQTLCDAVRQARESGVFVAAAAGNSNSAAPNYPAACPGAVGVAATDASDAPASFSNYGSPDVFVSAPGDSIYSTALKGTYKTMSGTSMATPFVAGLASQLLGQLPSRSPSDVAALLATSSDKIGSGYGADPYRTCSGCTWSSRYGYGRINMARALGAADFALSVSPPSATVQQGQSARVTVSVRSVNGYAGTVMLDADALPVGWSAAFAPSSVPASGSATLTLTTSVTSAPGTYSVTIRGTSASTVRATKLTVVLEPLVGIGTGPPQLPPLPPLPVDQPPPSVPPVTPPAPADFAVAITPSSQQSRLGAPVTYAITLTGSGVGAVDLSVSGLPGGVAAVLAPSSATVPGVATLTITPTPATPSGAYTFTVTASGGGVTRSASATLRVS